MTEYPSDKASKLVDFFASRMRLTEEEQEELSDLLASFAEAYAQDAIDAKFNEGRYRY